MTKKVEPKKAGATTKTKTEPKKVEFEEIELDDGVYLFTDQELRIAKERSKRYGIGEKPAEPEAPKTKNGNGKKKDEGKTPSSTSAHAQVSHPSTISKINNNYNMDDMKFVETNNEHEQLEYAIKTGNNALVKGPTGCGKTVLISEMARKYGKVLYTISCDIELDKSELIGKYEVKDGKTVWIQGIIPQAMIEGAWIVYDEVNVAKSEVLTSQHAVFDHRKELVIKEHQNETIRPHPDFRIFGTMNPDYVGTSALNYALRRRFQNHIDVDYLDPEAEKKLIIKLSDIADDIAEKIVKIGTDTRKLYSEGSLPEPVSTAHLIEFAKMLKQGFKPLECARVCLNISDEKGDMEDVLNAVRNYF